LKENQFVLGVIVANHFGVLTRVSGLFSRRGFNIDSLNVGETEDPRFSRMTIIVRGDEYVKTQVVHQLEKLHDVKRVELLEQNKTVLREHMLIKINTKGGDKNDIINVINVYRAKIVDYSADSITVEVMGEPSKLDAFIEFSRPYGILEICRAGALAMKRG